MREFLMGVLILPLLLLIAALLTWTLSPMLQERALIFTLFSAPRPIQRLCARELRYFPTKDTAVALAAFANLEHPYRLRSREFQELQLRKSQLLSEMLHASEDREKLERKLRQVEDKMARLTMIDGKQTEIKRQVAEEALISLCFLSGQTFGADFRQEGGRPLWKPLTPERYGTVLDEVNIWAIGMFGVEALVARGVKDLVAPPGDVQVEIRSNIPDAVTVQPMVTP